MGDKQATALACGPTNKALSLGLGLERVSGTHSISTAASKASGTNLTSGSSLTLLTLRSGGSLKSRVTLGKATQKDGERPKAISCTVQAKVVQLQVILNKTTE